MRETLINSTRESGKKRDERGGKHSPINDVAIVPGSVKISRKASCACGGGCPSCQAKHSNLPVSQPNDAAEIEADQIAEKVMRMPNSNSLNGQRKENPSSKSAAADYGSVLNTSGKPLETGTRDFFESRFNYDFSRVRIHHDEKTAEFAEQIDARAFTVGNHISFGKDEYQPYSSGGRKLLAHELAHVVQQDGGFAQRMIQRDEKKKPDEKKTPKDAAPVALPKLDLQASKNGDPCACLLVIHNSEYKARQTAQLMHEQCSYNLLLMQPITKERELDIKCIDPSRSDHPKDPNECFPPEISEMCLNDEKSCEQFLKDNPAPKKAADIQKFLQISFFLSIKNCSKNFTLPVVALHNNVISDTEKYLKEKDAVGVQDLKIDVDKSSRKTGEDKIKELQDKIDKKFGTEKFKFRKKNVTMRELLMETSGMTNIFRWCASPALAKCHIGDPDNPDNLLWVTNQKDFDLFSKKNVNVVLQLDPLKAKGTDAETDLSTLFPTVQAKLEELSKNSSGGLIWDIIIFLLEPFIKELEGTAAQSKDSDAEKPVQSDDHKTPEDNKLLNILLLLLKTLIQLPGNSQKGKNAVPDIHFYNIETPFALPGKNSGEVSAVNYDFIAGILKAAGLHCCGKNPSDADDKIKAGLKK